HEAVSLPALFVGQGHIEHHALVELAFQHLHLAFPAGTGAAIVGHGEACFFDRRQHGFARPALDLVTRRVQRDTAHDSVPVRCQNTGMMSFMLMSVTSSPEMPTSGMAGKGMSYLSSTPLRFSMALRQFSFFWSYSGMWNPASRATASASRWTAMKSSGRSQKSAGGSNSTAERCRSPARTCLVMMDLLGVSILG